MSKYTRECLEEVVKESASVSEVLRRLGIVVAGGSHSWISGKIKALGLDTSHFVNGNKYPPHKKKSSEEVLLDVGKNVHAHLLRRLMVEVGITEKCSGCGIAGEWNGQPIVLEVDHIDGKHCNNNKENLRFLCPNCHSQTVTSKPWKNKNKSNMAP